MSRYTLVYGPDCEIVVGFDPPLRSFFAQRFDPSRPITQDDLVDSWPTVLSLGDQQRIETEAQARLAIVELLEWLLDRGVSVGRAEAACVLLVEEWRTTPDSGEPALLRILRGAERRPA